MTESVRPSRTERIPLMLLPLILLFSCLLGWYALAITQAGDFSFLNHGFYFQGIHFFLYTLFALIALSTVWLIYSRALARTWSLPYPSALQRSLVNYLPLFFFLLLPLVTRHYLSSDDLISRLKLFGASILFAVFYLMLAGCNPPNRKKKLSIEKHSQAVTSWPLKKKILVLFFGSLFLYNAGSAVLTLKGSNFSGDEPHYLLITHSLLTDGDFDLSNNYANRDYERFMRPPVNIQRHTAPGTDGKYSFHSPGVSFLMWPFYSLGSLLSRTGLSFLIRLGMSLFGALLGLQIFLFALQEWSNEKLAFGLWALYSFTTPIFFYSIHVYPELIIALFSLTIFRIVRSDKKLSFPALCLLGFLLASFVWFHALKYIFIMIPLLVYTLWVLIKVKRVKTGLVYFLGTIVGVTAIYFYFQYTHYGSFSLSSVSWRGAVTPQESLAYMKQLIHGIPFRFRWETLAGYFFDQRDGLLLYAPIYFFAALGMLVMLKDKRRDLSLLFVIAAPYILSSSFLTQRTGYAPQARPLVAVSWTFLILIGYFLARNRKKVFTYFFILASIFSFLCILLLLGTPRALYQPTTAGEVDRAGRLFQNLSNLHFSLPKILPSYLKVEDPRWLPNWIWMAALIVFMAAYIIIRPHDFHLKYRQKAGLTFVGLTLFFLWFVYYPRTIIVHPQNVVYSSGEKVTYYAFSRSARMTEPGSFALVEGNRAYSFYFSSRRNIPEIQLDFGSAHGTYDVEIQYFDEVIFNDTIAEEIKTLRYPLTPYRLGRKNLYHITIILKNDPEISTAAHPFNLALVPSR